MEVVEVRARSWGEAVVKSTVSMHTSLQQALPRLVVRVCSQSLHGVEFMKIRCTM